MSATGTPAGQGVVEILPDGHEQPLGAGREVGNGVGELVDGVVFATVDFGQFPETHLTGFVERFKRFDTVFAGDGQVTVVEVVEQFSETGVLYGAFPPAGGAGLGLLFHLEGIDEGTLGVVGLDLLAFAAGDEEGGEDKDEGE